VVYDETESYVSGDLGRRRVCRWVRTAADRIPVLRSPPILMRDVKMQQHVAEVTLNALLEYLEEHYQVR
jgi:hypothetical protein